MQQQLTNMKNESELKSQQTEVCIQDFNEKIRVLSSSLRKKEDAVAKLQSMLQECQQVANSQVLGLICEMVELECRLQEAEYQKQQAELEKKAIVQEMNARRSFKAAHLGKL